jgi:hypothetical protein
MLAGLAENGRRIGVRRSGKITESLGSLKRFPTVIPAKRSAS